MPKEDCEAHRKRKPVVVLKHPSYQPSKAEREADMRINASPEQLARALGRQVKVRYSRPAPPKRTRSADCQASADSDAGDFATIVYDSPKVRPPSRTRDTGLQ